MTLSKRMKEDLFTLLDHSERDMSYQSGGSFALNPGEDEKVNVKDIQKVKRAIKFIEKIIK